MSRSDKFEPINDDLWVEWYRYEPKWPILVMPLVIPVGLLLAGIIFGEPAAGVMLAGVALVGSLLLCGKDLFRILRSMIRMRDREHLKKLLSSTPKNICGLRAKQRANDI